jgi:hypothetical protein
MSTVFDDLLFRDPFSLIDSCIPKSMDISKGDVMVILYHAKLCAISGQSSQSCFSLMTVYLMLYILCLFLQTPDPTPTLPPPPIDQIDAPWSVHYCRHRAFTGVIDRVMLKSL